MWKSKLAGQVKRHIFVLAVMVFDVALASGRRRGRRLCGISRRCSTSTPRACRPPRCAASTCACSSACPTTSFGTLFVLANRPLLLSCAHACCDEKRKQRNGGASGDDDVGVARGAGPRARVVRAARQRADVLRERRERAALAGLLRRHQHAGRRSRAQRRVAASALSLLLMRLRI